MPVTFEELIVGELGQADENLTALLELDGPVGTFAGLL